jgi:hypothetical protein
MLAIRLQIHRDLNLNEFGVILRQQNKLIAYNLLLYEATEAPLAWISTESLSPN